MAAVEFLAGRAVTFSPFFARAIRALRSLAGKSFRASSSTPLSKDVPTTALMSSPRALARASCWLMLDLDWPVSAEVSEANCLLPRPVFGGGKVARVWPLSWALPLDLVGVVGFGVGSGTGCSASHILARLATLSARWAAVRSALHKFSSISMSSTSRSSTPRAMT